MSHLKVDQKHNRNIAYSWWSKVGLHWTVGSASNTLEMVLAYMLTRLTLPLDHFSSTVF